MYFITILFDYRGKKVSEECIRAHILIPQHCFLIFAFRSIMQKKKKRYFSSLYGFGIYIHIFMLSTASSSFRSQQQGERTTTFHHVHCPPPSTHRRTTLIGSSLSSAFVFQGDSFESFNLMDTSASMLLFQSSLLPLRKLFLCSGNDHGRRRTRANIIVLTPVWLRVISGSH